MPPPHHPFLGLTYTLCHIVDRYRFCVVSAYFCGTVLHDSRSMHFACHATALGMADAHPPPKHGAHFIPYEQWTPVPSYTLPAWFVFSFFCKAGTCSWEQGTGKGCLGVAELKAGGEDGRWEAGKTVTGVRKGWSCLPAACEEEEGPTASPPFSYYYCCACAMADTLPPALLLPVVHKWALPGHASGRGPRHCCLPPPTHHPHQLNDNLMFLPAAHGVQFCPTCRRQGISVTDRTLKTCRRPQHAFSCSSSQPIPICLALPILIFLYTTTCSLPVPYHSLAR